MIKTNGLNHIALPVKDPKRSAQFYADLFNMKIVSVSTEMAFVATIGAGDLIAFGRSDVKIPSKSNTFHFGFTVTPEQFDEALLTIEEKGIKKASEPGQRGSGRYIFIEDPDGYTLEIFEYYSKI